MSAAKASASRWKRRRTRASSSCAASMRWLASSCIFRMRITYGGEAAGPASGKAQVRAAESSEDDAGGDTTQRKACKRDEGTTQRARQGITREEDERAAQARARSILYAPPSCESRPTASRRHADLCAQSVASGLRARDARAPGSRARSPGLRPPHGTFVSSTNWPAGTWSGAAAGSCRRARGVAWAAAALCCSSWLGCTSAR